MPTYSHSTTGKSAVRGTIGHKYIFHISGKSAVKHSTTQSSQHHHTVGRSSVKHTINQSSVHHHTVGRSTVSGAINAGLRHSTLGKSAVIGLARVAVMRHSTVGRSSILGGELIVIHSGEVPVYTRDGLGHIVKFPSPNSTVGRSAVIGIARQDYIARVPETQEIEDSTPVDVLPQVGSGIYTSWTHRRTKEITVNRLWDLRESGKANYSDTRNSWQLEMNVNVTKRDEIFQFILAHRGSGIPFVMYDLQNNNFQYDPLGNLNDGRYTVRYVDDSFAINQEVGSRQFSRFTLSFSVVEVE
jgi:hypothetical protein